MFVIATVEVEAPRWFAYVDEPKPKSGEYNLVLRVTVRFNKDEYGLEALMASVTVPPVENLRIHPQGSDAFRMIAEAAGILYTSSVTGLRGQLSAGMGRALLKIADPTWGQ